VDICNLLLQLAVSHKFSMDVRSGNKRHSCRRTMAKPVKAITRHTCFLAQFSKLPSNCVLVPRAPEPGRKDTAIVVMRRPQVGEF